MKLGSEWSEEKLEPMERVGKALGHAARAYIILQLGRGRPSREVVDDVMRQWDYTMMGLQNHMNTLRLLGAITRPGKGSNSGYGLTDFGRQMVYPSLLMFMIASKKIKATELAEKLVRLDLSPVTLDPVEQRAYQVETLWERALETGGDTRVLEGILAQCAAA